MITQLYICFEFFTQDKIVDSHKQDTMIHRNKLIIVSSVRRVIVMVYLESGTDEPLKAGSILQIEPEKSIFILS